MVFPVVMSYLLFARDGNWFSKGLNCSRMLYNAAACRFLRSWVTPLPRSFFFFDFDCDGPMMPSTLRDAFSCLSCDGGIFVSEVDLWSVKSKDELPGQFQIHVRA